MKKRFGWLAAAVIVLFAITLIVGGLSPAPNPSHQGRGIPSISSPLFIPKGLNPEGRGEDKSRPWRDSPGPSHKGRGDVDVSNITPEKQKSVMTKMAKIAVPFIANQGQIADPAVKYYAKTFGGTMLVTESGEMVYSLPLGEGQGRRQDAKAPGRQGPHPVPINRDTPLPKGEGMELRGPVDSPLKAYDNENNDSNTPKVWTLKETLVKGFDSSPSPSGSSSRWSESREGVRGEGEPGALAPWRPAAPTGLDQSSTRVNYFLGNDPAQWQKNLPTYNFFTKYGLLLIGLFYIKITFLPGVSMRRRRTWLLAILSLIVIVGMTGLAQAIEPLNKIVFYSNRDGNYEIYTMHTDGTNQTRLTYHEADDVDPYWSLDGSKVYFSSNRSGKFQIYVMNADGTNQSRITNNNANDRHPALSPDGTKIAFYTDRDGNSEIYVMNIDGTNPVNLTNNSSCDVEPFWSHNGTKIVFTSCRSNGSSIWVMNANGTNPTEVSAGSTWCGTPNWSPDDSKIIYASWGQLYIVNADGTNRVQLTNDPYTYQQQYNDYPSWSSDGTKILFARREGNVIQIYTMNPDGSNRISLTNSNSFNLGPLWSSLFSYIYVSPTSYDFGFTSVGSSSSPGNYTITNYRDSTLTFSSISLTGPDANQFALYNLPSSDLLAGNSANFQAQFQPTSTGPKQADITIISNDPDTPTINIHVTGGPARLVLDKEAFYGGAGDQQQYGTGSIAVNNGMVYVPGITGSYPDIDGLVVKYPLDLSAPLWSATWPGTADGDGFIDLAVTNEGLYIVGYAYYPTTDTVGSKEHKTVLVKAPPGGGTLTKIGEPHFFIFEGAEQLNAVTTTVEGGTTYIYAAGNAFCSSFQAFVLAKLDTAGNVLAKVTDQDPWASPPWALNFNSCSAPSAGRSLGWAMTTFNGNIYVAGSSSFEDGLDRPVLWKHDANLNLVWRKRAPGSGTWSSFYGVTAWGGYIYAVGIDYSSGNSDFIIQKYDEAGNLIWSKVSGGSGDDILNGIVGVGSRLFAVGYTNNQRGGVFDAVILEIDPATGDTLSTTLYGGAQDDRALGVTTDGTYLYVVGDSRSFAYNGNSVGQDDIIILRYKIESGPAANQPVISVAPGSKDFGAVNVYTNSAPQTFTITNTGTANLNIYTVDLTGTNAGEFYKYNDSGQSMLIPQASRTLQIEFRPTSAGAKSAALTITSDDPANSTVNVSLSGTAETPPPPSTLLSEGQVSPASGSPDTLYTYRVKYYDSGGVPPSMVLVEIDGDLHMMRLAQGTAANGYYQYTIPSLVYGSHTYDFLCLRSGLLYYYPDSEPYYLTGPSVTKGTSTITVSATPANFSLGQLVNLSGQINPGHQANVSLTFMPPSGSVPPLPVLTNSAGAFSVYYLPDAAGTWQVMASWNGDADHAGAASSAVTFSVGKTATSLNLTLVSQSIGLNDPLTLSGKLTAQNSSLPLTGLPITLAFIAPDGTPTNITTNVSNTAGQYNYTVEVPKTVLNTEGAWKVQAQFAGNSNYLASNSEQFEVNVSGTAGYFIIVQGTITGLEGSDAHAKNIAKVYDDLKKARVADDAILVYSPNTSYLAGKVPNGDWKNAGTGGLQPLYTKAAIQEAVTSWAKDKTNASAGPFYLVFVGHGWADPQTGQNGRFYLLENGTQVQIMPEEVDSWLDALESQLNANALAKRRFFIYGACKSGSFIPAVSETGRVIITSADATHDSYRGPNEPGSSVPDGEWFINRLFFYGGVKGKDLRESFIEAKKKVQDLYSNSPVTPLLDDNGDGAGHGDLEHNSGGDGLVAATEYIGLRSNADTPLIITQVSPAVYLNTNAPPNPTLEAWVNDIYLLSTMWITVRRPGDITSAGGGTGQVGEDLPVVVYTPPPPSSSEVSYKWTGYNDSQHSFYGFDQPGAYEVFFYAMDVDGNITSPVKTYVYRNIAGNQAPEPFSLISPANAVETSTTPALTWNLANDPNGDPVTYTLELALNSSFNLGLITRSKLTLPLYVVTPGDNLQDRVTYYWRVWAIDPYGARTLSSQSWSFNTNNTNVPLPIILQGYLLNSVSQEPIAYGAVVSNTGHSATSLFNGFYFMQVPSSTSSVNLTASAAGYITKNVGWVSLSNAVAYTVTKDITLDYTGTAPQVTAVSPGCGITGSAVTVTGINFGSYGKLKLNNAEVYVNPMNWSDTQITFTVPAKASSGPLLVRANGYNSNANFTFVVGNTPTRSINLVSASSGDAPGYTSSPNIQVNLTYTDASTVELSNDGSNWQSFILNPVGSGSMVLSWALTNGDGVKTVQAKFKNLCNKEAGTSGQITLNTLSLGGNPPDWTTGIPYSFTFTAGGGTGNNTWIKLSGSYPPGLDLNGATGELSGTPRTAGPYNFTLQVNDGHVTSEKAYRITITSNLLITTEALPAAYINYAYSPPGLTAQGGFGAYSWSFASAPPAWLNLSLSTAGYLSGTPTAAGSSDITIRVTDAGGNTKDRTFTLTVKALAIVGFTITDENGNPISITSKSTVYLNYTLGGSPTHYRISTGSTWGGWITPVPPTTLAVNLMTTQGRRDVYMQVKDAAGHYSEVAWAWIKVDTTAPKGVVQVNGGNTTVKEGDPVRLQMALLDANLTGAMMRIKNDTAFVSPADDGLWIDFATGKDWNLTAGTGSKKIYVQFKDGAGNKTSPSYYISLMVSASAPSWQPLTTSGISNPLLTGGASDPAGYTTGTTVNLTYTITGSNLQARYLYGTSWTISWEPVSGTVNRSCLLSSTYGPRQVYVQLKDTVTGQMTDPAYAEITLDPAAPTGTISINNGVAVKQNTPSVPLAIIASDTASGIDQMAVNDTGATPGSFEPFNPNKSFALNTSTTGTKYVYFWFKDKAGRISAKKSASISVTQ